MQTEQQLINLALKVENAVIVVQHHDLPEVQLIKLAVHLFLRLLAVGEIA